MSKKGVSLLVYGAFIAIVVVFSIVIIYSIMTNFELALHFRDFNLKFNNIAARLFYSPTCLAYENQYSFEGGIRYQVRAGVIDINKLERIKTCIHGLQYGSDYKVSIAKISSGTLNYIYENEKACDGEWTRTEKYFVIIRDQNKESPGVLTLCAR